MLKEQILLMKRQGMLWALSAFFSVTPSFADVAHGETLKSALARSYRDNPTLLAARAGQLVTDEALPQALAGWRPTVALQGSVTQEWSDSNATDSTSLTTKSIDIQLSQPIFKGFKTVEGIKKARADILTGRFNLQQTEQTVLYDVVTVYLDVWQNREIVTLRKKYVSNLKNQLRATKSRFDAGELTRTDVEQAKASLAQSQSALADARSDYQSSLAKYEQLVGHAAGNIILPKVPSVPGSLDSAHLKVIQRHPNVLAANSAVNAAGSSIEIAKGDLLPEIDLSATASATADPAVDIERSTSIQIQLSGKIALYDGGKTNSSVRQAVQTKSQRLLEVVETTRDVRKSVSEAWASHMSARQRIVSKVSEVSAARLALQGVQQEYQVGSRSTTDVLDAEQSLLEARIEQISARRDVVQAAYGLIFAMGELDKRHF